MVPDQEHSGSGTVDRVQIGVRMERSMVKVLKALAEFEGLSMGQLLEKIVLHSFEPVHGHEGEMSASPTANGRSRQSRTSAGSTK